MCVCVCVCAMSHVSPVLSRLKATTDQLIECVLLKKYTLLASLVGATATRYSDLGPRRREHAAPPRAAHANRRPASGEGARNRGAAARRKAAWFWAREESEDLRVAFRWRSERHSQMALRRGFPELRHFGRADLRASAARSARPRPRERFSFFTNLTTTTESTEL